MIVKTKPKLQESIPWSLIEELTGQNLTDWNLGKAQSVVIKLPERELHPTVAALNPRVFDAVDSRSLSTEDLRKLVTVRAAYELDRGRYVFEALSGKGTVGCALSHYAIWRALAARPDDNSGILVMEDDAKLLAPYTSLDALLDLVRPDDDFLLLSSNGFWPVFNRVPNARRRWAGIDVSGTRTYFLRARLARVLLAEAAWPINTQVDFLLRHYAYTNSVRRMQTVSGVVGGTVRKSTIGHSNVRCLPKFRLQIFAALTAAIILLLVSLSATIW